jgi:type VI secretion system protein
MPLKLTITSYQRLSPGQETSKSLDRGSINIGRAVHNDWVLQDPERILSKHHCTVAYQNGGYVLTDRSQNGTFFNEADQRIPKDQTISLQDGDHFVVGEYEIAVTVQDEDFIEDGVEEPVTDLLPPNSHVFDDKQLHAVNPQPSNFRNAILGSETPMSANSRLEDSLLGPRQVSGLPDSAFLGANAVATPAAPDLSTPERINFELPSLHSQVKPIASVPQSADPLSAPKSADSDIFSNSDPFVDSPPESSTEPEPEPEPLAEPFSEQPLTPEPLAPSPSNAVEPLPATEAKVTALEPIIPDDWWQQSPTTSEVAALHSPPLERSTPPQPAIPTTAANVANLSPPVLHERAVPPPNPVVAMADPTPPNTEVLLQAFFKGAGLPALKLSSSQAERIMHNLGGILRETTSGLIDILHARSAVKGEFRLERTAIGPIANNPLKTPPGQTPLSPEQVITLLLVGEQQAYMSAVDAVRESFDDIKAHQLAVMAGIQAALNRLLARFDPTNLETRLEQSVLDNLWPANRKAKYWDLFMAEYQAIARESEDDFKELFGDEFARAYAERLRSQ